MFFNWGYRANLEIHQSSDENLVELARKNNDGTLKFSKFISDFPEVDPSKKLYLNPWLFNGIFQTLYYSSSDSSQRFQIYYGREIFKYHDGGICSLDFVIPEPESKEEFQKIYKETLPEGWPRLMPRSRFFTEEELSVSQKHDQDTTKPICVVIHGLAGGSHEPLIRNLAENLTRGEDEGKWDVVVINSRGCCRTKITSAYLFTALSTDDIKEVVIELRKRYPKRPIYAAGFSFGAAILGRYLATDHAAQEIKAATLIGCPWDLNDSSRHILLSWSGKYLFNPAVSSFLVKLISNNFKELHEGLPEIFSKENMKEARSFKKAVQIDDTFTSKCLGFKNAEEYYTFASPQNVIDKIKTPTLILNSTDDPTVGVILPIEQIEKNPYLCLVKTDLGGHLAWALSGGKFWSVECVEKFFDKFEEEY